jgi:DNA-binding transcriptional LysR family regulator
MDRIDEWRVFAAVEQRRSFTRAARDLRRSPQAVTRAVAALEGRLGVRLFHRTTRSVSLTDVGERYRERSQRALAEFDLLEARLDAQAELRGLLSVTAPVLFGQLHVLPVALGFMALHPALEVRLVLLDRVVSLAEEGIDLGVRIGALPDSSLRARGIGQVRSVVCASPAYLRRAGVPRVPADLARHTCIAFSGTSPGARWSFPARAAVDAKGAKPSSDRRRDHSVAVRARLQVNTAQAAIDAALADAGCVRVLSYQVKQLVADKRLRIVLPSFEPEPRPVHVVHVSGGQNRAAAAFIDHAADELRRRIT